MRRGEPGTMERRKEESLHLSFSSFPSRAPFSHASSVFVLSRPPRAVQVKTTGHQSIQDRNLYRPWLNYLAAKRKEKQLYCSRRLGGGHTLSKIFFRCTVSSILQGSIKANFYYWNHSTFVPFWNLCVQNSSPYLRASGPKLLTVVCSVSSSELLDYFRLHIRFQCSGNIIEHIQDHFCLRKRTTIYPITNFICVIQLQPDGLLFEISNKWVIKKLC